MTQTVLLENSSNRQFWGMTQAVLLENSSKRKHLVENNISRILGRDVGRITGKLIQTILQSSYWNASTKYIPKNQVFHEFIKFAF